MLIHFAGISPPMMVPEDSMPYHRLRFVVRRARSLRKTSAGRNPTRANVQNRLRDPSEIAAADFFLNSDDVRVTSSNKI